MHETVIERLKVKNTDLLRNADIAEVLGLNQGTVKNRLDAEAKAGRVLRVKAPCGNQAGFQWLYPTKHLVKYIEEFGLGAITPKYTHRPKVEAPITDDSQLTRIELKLDRLMAGFGVV
ncbi:MAG: hypothetical protein ACXWOV_02810 [Isosphaeraceae bacterium]